ncbi:MAG: hypothetical protein BRD48_04765 [Bacteroidetes bacterium QS_9_68_14]|nr:MAG: hypothetical protein BRD48_04765 [Bacteroidetes bacterium QS_9_68_14]
MSQASPFPERFFDSPEADPLNKTDLLSPGEEPSRPSPSAERGRRERGLDSVFAASSALGEADPGAPPQKAIFVTRTARATDGLDELNRALQSGWELMHVTLMGDSEKNARWLSEDEADAYFSALVFVEQTESEA